jgi:single-strand DNA-binding protein
MYQKLTIVGHLGQDPEMRYLPDGTAVTNLSVATNRRWTNQKTGQTEEETCWFRVAVWGKQAEAANQYLRKGRQVLVEGRLRPDPETGGPRLFSRRDGSVGASFEMTAGRVQFLGSRNGTTPANGNGYGQANGGVPAAAAGGAQEEDNIPF